MNLCLLVISSSLAFIAVVQLLIFLNIPTFFCTFWSEQQSVESGFEIDSTSGNIYENVGIWLSLFPHSWLARPNFSRLCQIAPSLLDKTSCELAGLAAPNQPEAFQLTQPLSLPTRAVFECQHILSLQIRFQKISFFYKTY